jgi:hypothetical protein
MVAENKHAMHVNEVKAFLFFSLWFHMLFFLMVSHCFNILYSCLFSAFIPRDFRPFRGVDVLGHRPAGLLRVHPMDGHELRHDVAGWQGEGDCGKFLDPSDMAGIFKGSKYFESGW